MKKGDKVIKRLLILISVLLAVILVVELVSLTILNSLKEDSNLKGELATYSLTTQYITSSSSSSQYQSSSSSSSYAYANRPCTPNCDGKSCGASNGCGGECDGTCPTGLTCKEVMPGDFQCVCVPNCDRKVCGDDRCGGSCGTCTSGKVCQWGGCVCIDDCSDKQCGINDCGENVCGTCPTGQFCEDGSCVTTSRCSETDGGKNYNLQGTTSVGTSHKRDYCVSSTKLQEFYCSSGELAWVSYYCNCNSGRCV